MRNLLLTTMLLGAAAVFLLFWLSPPEIFLKSPVSDTEELPKADSYMLNITKLDFDSDGTQVFQLDATEARHYNSDNLLELEQPTLISFHPTESEQPWHIRANQGTVTNDGARAVFQGQVYAWQLLNNDKKNELETEKLIVHPHERTTETDAKVTITTPRGNTVGIGMKSDLNKETFSLHARVRGIYHAQ